MNARIEQSVEQRRAALQLLQQKMEAVMKSTANEIKRIVDKHGDDAVAEITRAIKHDLPPAVAQSCRDNGLTPKSFGTDYDCVVRNRGNVNYHMVFCTIAVAEMQADSWGFDVRIEGEDVDSFPNGCPIVESMQSIA